MNKYLFDIPPMTSQEIDELLAYRHLSEAEEYAANECADYQSEDE